jgi:transcriptional regulator with XRE-family HTH domain
MELGDRLRARRKALKLSGGKVAAALGISAVHVFDIENKKRGPSLDLLCRFARHYGVTTDYLLGLDETVPEVMPQDAYVEALTEILDDLSEVEKATLVEIGRAFQRVGAERQEEAVNQVFLRMMEDVEQGSGEDAAKELYSAMRLATAGGDVAVLRRWFGRYMGTPAKRLPDPGE